MKPLLLPEWRLCRVKQLASGQADVFEDVVIHVAQPTELSAGPHPLPPASQQTNDPLERRVAAELLSTVAVGRPDCNRYWAGCRL